MGLKKVIITGGTGLIGKNLRSVLLSLGYDVYLLSRKKLPDGKGILWDPAKAHVEKEKLRDTYALIHLAGSGIADGRWTEARKKEIIASRVDTAQLLFKAYKELGQAPEVLVSASGIGYYGADTGDVLLNEEAPFTQDFISKVCQLWEEAALQFEQLSTRVVLLRTGIVLSAEGGALPRLSQSIRMLAGAPIASGKQYMSWIHMHDMCHMYVEAIEKSSYIGVYNAVATAPATNKEFTEKVAKVLHKPLWLPNIPTFVMKLAFGDMASLLTGGNRVSNQKIRSIGFQLKFPDLETALRDLFKA